VLNPSEINRINVNSSPHKFKQSLESTTMDTEDAPDINTPTLSDDNYNTLKMGLTEKQAAESTFRTVSQSNVGPLLTPPPTRQQTPASPTILQEFSFTPISENNIPAHTLVIEKKWPQWAVVSAQVLVTLPLYIFAFWLMIEGLKAGGEDLVDLIDYLAFRPSM